MYCSIAGIKRRKPTIFSDSRGKFLEAFRSEIDSGPSFVQDNLSYSRKHVLRGMHFQSGQAKQIRCIKGIIFDVVVDMRENSNTFGCWESFLLDDEKSEEIFIPDGCAHGFCVLSDEAIVYYKITDFYDPTKERGFHYADKEIGIEWPIDNPLLSERDRHAKSFGDR